MDEMLSIALWVMAAFLITSASVTWFNAQPDINQFNLGMTGYDANSINITDYQDTNCSMTSLIDLPAYAWCSSVGQITSPITALANSIWNLLTGWTQLMHAIFVSVPAGDFFEGILTPLLAIIEIAAVLILLMRLAAIIRGSG